ncbi:minor tail protein [Pseudomonas phage vB_PpS_SYP]|nr:minor tail protein [Pseudomonas phage vB_PpS_SYP]
MAIETFTWPVEREIDPTIEYKTTTVQFGDGYVQEIAEGINNKTEEYSIRVHAYGAEAKSIKDFFDRHQGYKSFYWTPPLGDLGLYRCKNAVPRPQGGGLYVFSGTFVKVYAA